MEVSSHALVQYRVHGIKFDVGLFTNLTQDHMDYHKTFEEYLQAKKILFLNSKKAVVNVDDPYSSRIMEGLTIPILTFGVRDRADISATDIDITTDGVQFDLHTPEGEVLMHLAIPGLFLRVQRHGALVGMAQSVGIKLGAIKAGLESLRSVSGRLEPVRTNREFAVFVDYAHTPDALENVLKTVREFAKGRVICVLWLRRRPRPRKAPHHGRNCRTLLRICGHHQRQPAHRGTDEHHRFHRGRHETQRQRSIP